MKHTTFENELRDIRRRAISELRDAIKAHGGRYEYSQFDHMPKIGGFEKTEVYEAFLLEDLPTFQTLDRFVTATDSDLSIDDILTLTDYIVESEEVEDVSGAYPVPVTYVDTDDIETNGFDSEGLTQDKLNEIAEQMQDYYCASAEFSSNLYDACLACGLKEKED